MKENEPILDRRLILHKLDQYRPLVNFLGKSANLSFEIETLHFNLEVTTGFDNTKIVWSRNNPDASDVLSVVRREARRIYSTIKTILVLSQIPYHMTDALLIGEIEEVALIVDPQGANLMGQWVGNSFCLNIIEGGKCDKRVVDPFFDLRLNKYPILETLVYARDVFLCSDSGSIDHIDRFDSDCTLKIGHDYAHEGCLANTMYIWLDNEVDDDHLQNVIHAVQSLPITIYQVQVYGGTPNDITYHRTWDDAQNYADATSGGHSIKTIQV